MHDRPELKRLTNGLWKFSDAQFFQLRRPEGHIFSLIIAFSIFLENAQFYSVLLRHTAKLLYPGGNLLFVALPQNGLDPRRMSHP